MQKPLQQIKENYKQSFVEKEAKELIEASLEALDEEILPKLDNQIDFLIKKKRF